jgi:radical SAM-linked protein
LEQLIRVKYSKDEPIRYISHLNLVQVFTRALRRANIPVVISYGFNPRFRISFGPPLPLGISSSSEYLDIRLKERIKTEDLVGRLNRVLPEGLKILEAKIIPSSADSLAKVIDRASYLINLKSRGSLLNLDDDNGESKLKELAKEIDKDIKIFLRLEEIMVEKSTKKGVKRIDIKPSILDMSVKKIQHQFLELNLRLNIGQEGNLNPQYVIKAWLSHFGNNFDIKKICRYGLYIKGKEVIED